MKTAEIDGYPHKINDIDGVDDRLEEYYFEIWMAVVFVDGRMKYEDWLL